jgi:hypothetical protein
MKWRHNNELRDYDDTIIVVGICGNGISTGGGVNGGSSSNKSDLMNCMLDKSVFVPIDDDNDLHHLPSLPQTATVAAASSPLPTTIAHDSKSPVDDMTATATGSAASIATPASTKSEVLDSYFDDTAGVLYLQLSSFTEPSLMLQRIPTLEQLDNLSPAVSTVIRSSSITISFTPPLIVYVYVYVSRSFITGWNLPTHHI